MDEKKLKALATELAKGLKTEANLNAFSRMLTKLTIETDTRQKRCFVMMARLNSTHLVAAKIPSSLN